MPPIARATALLLAAAGCVLLVVAEFSTLYEIRVITVIKESTDGREHHGTALLVIALAAAFMAYGGILRGARPAQLALLVLALAALAVVLFVDYPDVNDEGFIGEGVRARRGVTRRPASTSSPSAPSCCCCRRWRRSCSPLASPARPRPTDTRPPSGASRLSTTSFQRRVRSPAGTVGKFPPAFERRKRGRTSHKREAGRERWPARGENADRGVTFAPGSEPERGRNVTRGHGRARWGRNGAQRARRPNPVSSMP
jgi:hypothetical protein